MDEQLSDPLGAPFMRRMQIERVESWRNWADKIPGLRFSPDWFVQVVPPFGGAIARFRVWSVNNPEKVVSVYLDAFDRLGSMGKPYWELWDGSEIERFELGEVEDLIKAIGVALESKKIPD